MSARCFDTDIKTCSVRNKVFASATKFLENIQSMHAWKQGRAYDGVRTQATATRGQHKTSGEEANIQMMSSEQHTRVRVHGERAWP